MDKFFSPAVLDAGFGQADLALARFHERKQQIEAARAAREQEKVDAAKVEQQRYRADEVRREAEQSRLAQIRADADFVADPKQLVSVISRYAYASPDHQEAIRMRFDRCLADHLEDHSKIDFHALPFEGRLIFLPLYLGLTVGKDYPRFDFNRSSRATNEYLFNSHFGPADARPWRERKAMIDRYLGGAWQVRELDGTTVKLWSMPELPERIPFDRSLLRPGQMLFGIRCDTGQPYYTSLADLTHLLICGQTGKGKSTLSKGLIISLLANLDLIDSLTLVDLKAGLELARYATLHPKIRFIDSYDQLPPLIDAAIDVMQARFQELRAAGEVKATSGFHVFLIDEFAVIESNKTVDKNAHAALKAKLNLLGQQARAAGIKLIVMSQRPTADSIDSNLKTNLPSAISFMMSSTQNIQQMFAGEALPVDVTTLPRGEFVFRDDAVGQIVHLKALSTDDVDMALLSSLIPDTGDSP